VYNFSSSITILYALKRRLVFHISNKYSMEIMKIIRHTLQILEGWTKWIYDMIRRDGSVKSLRRLVVCQKCEHNKKGICQECGCIIKAKVRVEYPEDERGISIGGCPEEKW
jgi:hypothetical protein